MKNFIRNTFIAIYFEAKMLLARAKHMVASLFRPQIWSLDHITIPVKDLNVARSFYCDLLGATHFMTVDEATLKRFGRSSERGGQGAHHISVFLAGATRIDLFLQDGGQPPSHNGHPHYAFKVPPFEMQNWKRLLETKGIPTDGPIRLGPPGQASMYFNDPFGNHLEVTCFGYPGELPVRAPKMTALEWGIQVAV